MAKRQEIHEALAGVSLNGKFRPGESGWWISYCEEVPEARTQGETLEEARENLRDAVAFILEDFSGEELDEFREQLAL